MNTITHEHSEFIQDNSSCGKWSEGYTKIQTDCLSHFVLPQGTFPPSLCCLLNIERWSSLRIPPILLSGSQTHCGLTRCCPPCSFSPSLGQRGAELLPPEQRAPGNEPLFVCSKGKEGQDLPSITPFCVPLMWDALLCAVHMFYYQWFIRNLIWQIARQNRARKIQAEIEWEKRWNQGGVSSHR